MTAIDHPYAAALAYLYGLTDWEQRRMDRAMRERLLLERPAALLERLGRPQDQYRTVLVAGTKGKGSTAAMLASILQAAGHRTGLYTQPHLHTYRERMRVDGTLISSAEVAAGVARLKPHVEALSRERPELGVCTTYEVSTALALDHFARTGVAVAVLEVGLGGRLDATNVVAADLALIASISFDHTAVLGTTLPEIAAEKAGIVKPGRPVLAAPQRPEVLAVLQEIAATRRAPLGVGSRDWDWTGDHAAFEVTAPQPRPGLWPRPWRYEGVRVPLLGAHQLVNAAVAIAAAAILASGTAAGALAIPAEAVVTGVAATWWPARLEVYSPRGPDGPTVVIDGAHNGDSAAKLAVALTAHFQFERLWLVLGVGSDKDLEAIVAPLAPLVSGAWTAASRHPRSRPAADAAATLEAASVCLAVPAPDTATALRSALDAALPGDLVCVTGSLFIAAEAREALGVVPPDACDPAILPETYDRP